jgi:hypothetical protein
MTRRRRATSALERVSANVSLRFRENGVLRVRDNGVETAAHIQLIVSRNKAPARNPANSELFVRHLENLCLYRTAWWRKLSQSNLPGRDIVAFVDSHLLQPTGVFGGNVMTSSDL